MASMALLRFSTQPHNIATFNSTPKLNQINPPNRPSPPSLSCSGGNGIDGTGDGWSGGGGDGGDDLDDGDSSSWKGFGVLGLFLCGWRSRVAADPQFPFKVLMEELVGVTANVAGDMASRPNFGLNELDFVFSTLIVGSILNFTLMYILAPTATSTAATLPEIHALAAFARKGAVFAAVGFAAGLAGTAVTNGLMAARKRVEPPNKAPPAILNALTWAVHMGISANLRYQALNGVELVLGKALPPVAFRSTVVGLRCVNNLVGGMGFVALARLTGSQSQTSDLEVEEDKKPI